MLNIISDIRYMILNKISNIRYQIIIIFLMQEATAGGSCPKSSDDSCKCPGQWKLGKAFSSLDLVVSCYLVFSVCLLIFGVCIWYFVIGSPMHYAAILY